MPTMLLIILLSAVVCLAYANGANDNFKGVATLFGSGTTRYREALIWATASTLAGSLTAMLLASQLITRFSGKGLVSDALAADGAYGAAVALGAGLTVLLATRLGLPISTTHSMIGSLVGAAWSAQSATNLSLLTTRFLLPLLVSPFLAILGTGLLYFMFRKARYRLGIGEETCICVGNQVLEVMPLADGAALSQRISHWTMQVGDAVVCRRRYQGSLLGIEMAPVVDKLHFLSAGIVSFARGLNDTPKIAAMLLLVPFLNGFAATALVGAFIAVGGLLSARRVAETMSRKITPMNHGQGLTANLMTGLIVIGASRLGLPVSTTHVSCGGLFGIGIVTSQADLAVVGRIVLAWVTTLPLGAALGAVSFWLIERLF